MKRILSFLLVALMIFGLLPTNAIHAHAADSTETLTVYGTTGTKSSDSSSISWTSNDVTFTNKKGSTAIRTSDSDHYRVYAGSSATISAPGNITKIVVTCTSASYATIFNTSATNNGDGATVTTSSSTVTIAPTASSQTYSISSFTAQTRISAVAVTYAEATSACEHTNTTTTTVDATCNTAGSTTVVCSDCGETVSTTEIPATVEHTTVTDAAVAATCAATGLTEGSHCSVCNTVITAQEVIPALGHSYVLNGTTYTCSVCDASYETFFVSFSVPNGITSIADIEYVDGGIKLPTPTETPTGDGTYTYTFAGWVTDTVDNSTTSPTIYEAGSTYTANEAVTLYAVYTYEVEGEGDSGSGDYVKVTVKPADWSGEYVIVYEDSSYIFNGSLAEFDAVSNYKAVTITDNTIAASEADNYNFTIATVDGGYSIQGTSGGYIGHGSDANDLTTNSSALVNTISLNDDGSANIICSGGAYLRFNATSGQTRFRYYKSGSYTNQKPIALYKKSSGVSSTTYYTTVISGGTTEECEHSYNSVVTAPTCTEAGYTTYTCSKCGDSYTDNETEATGHSYNSVVTAPTCTEGGFTTYTCSGCSHSYTDSATEALGHSYENGVCTVCGAAKPTVSSNRYYIAAIRASGNYFYMTSDLGTAGTKRYTAVDSGLTELPEYIEVSEAGYVFVLIDNGDGTYSIQAEGIEGDNYLGHTSGNSGTLVAEASALKLTMTENDDGTYSFSYAASDATRYLALNDNTGNDYFAWYKSGQKQNLTLIPVGTPCSHTNTENHNAVAPTCTAEGYTAGVYCNDCEKYISGHEEIAALGHSYTSVTTDPTCTEAGKAVYTCSACGDSYEEVIAAQGHSYTAVTTNPTCTETGKTVYTCSVCGHNYEEEIPATGHTEVIDAAVAATCTATGLTEGSHCSVCNEVLIAQEETSALGHNYQAVITLPTCTTTGYTTYTCANGCSNSYTADEVVALGHTEVVDAYVAPTCTTTGLTEGKHCSVCNEVLIAQESIDSLGHSWNDGEITTAATCTATGVKTYTCNTCGETKTETLPIINHSYEGVVGNGTITYTCSVCGDSYSMVDDSQLVGTYELVTDITDILEGGIFVVAAKSGDNYYAMGNELSSALESTLVTVNDNQVVYAAGYPVPVWLVNAVNGISVSLTPDGTNYLTWSYTTSFGQSTEEYYWTIEEGSIADNDSDFLVYSTNTSDRAITLSSGGFKPYSRNTAGYNRDIYFFKLIQSNVSEYTLTFKENNVISQTVDVATENQVAVYEMPNLFGTAPEGYSFVGWVSLPQEESLYKPDDAEIYFPGQTYTFSSDKTLYALYTRHDPNEPGLGTIYQPVAEDEELVIGGLYAIVSSVTAEDGTVTYYAMTADQRSDDRGSVAVTVEDDNTISFASGDNVAIFQLAVGNTDGTYSFLDTKLNKFLAYGSGDNSMLSQTSIDSKSSFVIGVDSDDIWKIIYQGGSEQKHIGFNPTIDPIKVFAFYDVNSLNTNYVSLYKAVATDDGADYYTTIIDCIHDFQKDESSYKAPTCTETGYALYICANGCGEQHVEIIPALGHTEVVDAAVAATCTATGLTEGSHCSVCNEVLVKQNEVAALGHEYSDLNVNETDYLVTSGFDAEGNKVQAPCPTIVGTCSRCNASNLVIAELRFVSAAPVLENTLVMNYCAPENVLGDGKGFTNVTATFTYGKRVGDYAVVANLDENNTNAKGYYILPCSMITPSQIGDEITATITGDYEGKTYSFKFTGYSVAQYCYNMLKETEATKEANAALRTLLVDLLYYCDAARVYSTYKANESVTGSLTDDQKAEGTSTTPILTSKLDAQSSTIDAPTASWNAASLVLYQAIAMKLRFTAEGVENPTVQFQIGDNTYTYATEAVEGATDQYYAIFENINAFQMRDLVYATVYDGETVISNTLCYSVESYAYAKQNDTNTKLVNLLIAMMRYGDSAEAYANRNKEV